MDRLIAGERPAGAEAAMPSRKKRGRKSGAHGAEHWARFGVAFTLVLSAGLNGYANAQHAPLPWAGWLMGLAVPVLVLVLSKVGGEKWLASQKSIARFAGGSGVALLLLSVWHCANSIALLTGSGLVLAVPMAVSVDCGLVACEVAIITAAAKKAK